MYSDKPILHERMNKHKPGELRTVAIDVTPVCNMQCAHCYAETFREKGPVRIDILLRALDEFYGLGVFHYVFQGGEPLMAPDRLETIIRGAHPEATYITVVSNGWSMTRQRICWLKGLQVDKIAFSLDSGIREEHDANRLPGSFDRVLHALDDVISEGLNASVSVTVTHQSLHGPGFERALEIARNKGIRVDVQIAEPVGKWDGNRDFLITPEDSAFIKQLQQTMGRLPNGQNRLHRDIFCGGADHCPAGNEFMAVSSDGHLLPCNFLQYTLGQIGETPIAQMRRALIESPWFDGSHPDCLIGENGGFINECVHPYREDRKPLDAYRVFGIEHLASDEPADSR